MRSQTARLRGCFCGPLARYAAKPWPAKARLMLDLQSACARLLLSTCAEITNEFAGLILGGKE